MIKQKIQDEINAQIQAEFQSAYMYLAFSGWFEGQNYIGFAGWMKCRWQKEIEQAMKLREHLLKRNGHIDLQTIEAPNISGQNPKEIFEQALEHERNITKKIHSLYNTAQTEGDYPLENMLLWFIDGQTNLENELRYTVGNLKRVGGNETGVLMIEKEVAQRNNLAK